MNCIASDSAAIILQSFFPKGFCKYATYHNYYTNIAASSLVTD